MSYLLHCQVSNIHNRTAAFGCQQINWCLHILDFIQHILWRGPLLRPMKEWSGKAASWNHAAPTRKLDFNRKKEQYPNTKKSSSSQVLKYFTHTGEMFIVLNFEVFILKWGRDVRWALANTTIKYSEGNLHRTSISLTLWEKRKVVSRTTKMDLKIHPHMVSTAGSGS